MKRMSYLDGLKGWCAISVGVFHFLLMFMIAGYVGWMAMPEAVANPFDYYFANFPYSILTNNSFPLYIFFAIMSFIICYGFLKKKDEEKLKKQAILRYFRFLPIVFISCLIGYLLLEFDLCQIGEFYNITKNEWMLARIQENYTFWDLLRIGLVGAFVEGTQIVSPFWCMHYIFLGSMLTYFIMFIYNKVKNKPALLTFVAIAIIFIDPNYLSFVVGIIAAVIVNKEIQLKKRYGIIIILLGIIIGLFPPVLLPKSINIAILYAIGAGLILIGTHCCFQNNFFLNNKFIGFVGRESFSFIIVQFLIQQSLNAFLFVVLFNAGMDLWLNILLNFTINMLVALLFTIIYSKTVTPLTNKLCKTIDTTFLEHNENPDNNK